MRRTKGWQAKREKMNLAQGAYSLPEAVARVKAVARDWETIDVAVRLAVDPRKADQNVRGSVVLPHGTGKEVRVAVFTKGEKENEAREAGADLVGLEDIIEQVKNGKIDFDVAVATPDVMKEVSKVAKVLGPRRLMPNPKSGTVTFDVARAVKEFKGGKMDFRVEKAGIVHCVAGKGSFTDQQVVENVQALLGELVRLKPASARGVYIKSIALSATESPSVKVDVKSTGL
ncbi:MAG: 50S ribosomal protein L1 [Planctomycetales bacterium 4484_113]|nr:MAG: 50S ribosomal protein L1 [Planctomycetales bacterium 4484_113]